MLDKGTNPRHLTGVNRQNRFAFFTMATGVVLVGWLGARALALGTQSVSDDWVATKTLMAFSLMGANSAQSMRQTVAHGRLNLDAWFGEQEFLLNRSETFDAVEVAFDVE